MKLEKHHGISPQSGRQKVVIVGHDRGARIAHRLTVDNNHPHFEIIASALLDIVPTWVQWQSFADPACAKGYYHWSFLAAAPPLPENMMSAFGGGRWAEQALVATKNERLAANLPYYMEYFDRRATIDAACADYRAGATVDCEEQIRDQKEGRKLKVPILVIYSNTYVGSHFDVKKIWREWIADDSLLQCVEMANGVGHYMAEEDPDTITQAILTWFREVVKIQVY